MSRPSEANACWRALAPFQRRLALTACARRLPVVCAAALGALDILLYVLRPDARVIAMSSVAIVAMAMAGTYAYSVMRPPSLLATASHVDVLFRLDDIAVTALQFSDAPDPVSHLVVSAATTRLDAINPSRIPLTVSAPSLWLAVSLLAVPALVGVVTSGDEPARLDARETGHIVDSRIPRNASARASDQSNRPRVGNEGGAPLSRDAGAASDQRTAAREANQVPRASREDGVSRSTAGTNSRAADQGDPVPSHVGQIPTSGENLASSVRGAGDGEATSGATSSAARGGRGGSLATSDRVAAGGVRDGRLIPSATRDAIATSIVPASPVTYRRAVEQAEAAIARDRVPARLRAYVRDYFVAIRPGQGQ